MMKTGIILAALIWTSAPQAQMRSIEVGFSGLLTDRTDLEPIRLSAGRMDGGEYRLLSGGYYRIEIIADGTQEIAVEGPEFFRGIWVNEVVIEDIEIRPMGISSLEFDNAGTASLSFVAILPGRYELRIAGTSGETQRVELSIE